MCRAWAARRRHAGCCRPCSAPATRPATAAAAEHWRSRGPARRSHDPGWKVALAFALSAPLVLPMLGDAVRPALDAAGGVAVRCSPRRCSSGSAARFYRAGWMALRAGTGNMDLLVALGTSAAFGLSLVLWCAAGGMPHLYFESAAVVITLVLFGKWLEARAKRRTLAALDALRALRPQTARACCATAAKSSVPLAEVRRRRRGGRAPGERMPVDARDRRGRAATSTNRCSPARACRWRARPATRSPAASINGEGLLRAARARGRRGDAAGAHRAAGGIGAGEEGADPAAGRPRQRGLRAGGAGRRRCSRCSAGAWPRATGPRPRCMRCRCWSSPAPARWGWPRRRPSWSAPGWRRGAASWCATRRRWSRCAPVKLVAFDKTGTLTEGKPRLVALRGRRRGDRARRAAGAGGRAAARQRTSAGARGAAGCRQRGRPRARRRRRCAPCPAAASKASVQGRQLRLGSARWRDELGADGRAAAAAVPTRCRREGCSAVVADGRRAGAGAAGARPAGLRRPAQGQAPRRRSRGCMRWACARC